MTQVIEWLEHHQLPCIYRETLGIPCPACGLQRAFIELLQGDVIESFRTFPPLLPVLVLFLFLGLHLVFRFRFGAWFLKVWAVLTGTMMIINYMYTIFSH